MLEWLLQIAPLLPMLGFFWGGCPCCSTAVCGACSGDVPAAWSATFSGIAQESGSFCTDCTALNGTWVMDYVTDCIWRYEDSDMAAESSVTSSFSGVSVLLQMFCAPLLSSGSHIVAYQKTDSGSTTDCTASHSLPLDIDNFQCTGWPSTVTLSPV